VQYWTGSSWATVPGGSISGNNLVWRKLTFAAITTSKIRVMVTAAATDGVARIAEIEAWTTSPNNNTTVNWLVPDHLGTPRIILDQTGSFDNVKRHDYLPFGEELYAGTGGRNASMGYVVGDFVRQQFTRKERDVETGLDYFLARYYAATQGRFTSPDEFTGGPAELFSFTSDASQNPTFYADLTNPQSLNKYQYTYNNPLGMTDDSGHCPACISETHRNVNEGVIMEIANIGLGINNLMADFKIGNAKHVQLFEPANKTQEAAMKVTGDVLFFAGLLTGRAQVGGVAIAEGETTAVTSARVASTNEAAVNTANQAQGLPRSARPGAAGAGTAVTGERFTATSGSAKLHPTVEKLLDGIPAASRSRTHGACCEPKIISQMLNAGVNPKGATISVVRVRGVGNPNHATFMGPCSTCRLMLDAINNK
jgi:RHS repeat-associated protein